MCIRGQGVGVGKGPCCPLRRSNFPQGTREKVCIRVTGMRLGKGPCCPDRMALKEKRPIPWGWGEQSRPGFEELTRCNAGCVILTQREAVRGRGGWAKASMPHTAYYHRYISNAT